MIGKLMAGAVLAAIVTAAPANADLYGSEGDHDAVAYEMELHDAGMPLVEGIAPRRLALTVCAQRADGADQIALIKRLTPDYSAKLSVAAVLSAEFHFCPQFLIRYPTPNQNMDATTVAFTTRGGHRK